MTEFVKMHGAGNDFVVIDNRDARFTLEQLIAVAPHWCDRRFGIGADGLLVLQESDTADYTMIYRNADGSDAGMCGNGGRCIAAFARSLGVPASHRFECNGHVYAASEHGELTGGFKAVADQLTLITTRLGLEKYGQAGEAFDPQIHEALLHDTSADVAVATATKILQPGYKYKERVLRPARVAVTDPAEFSE